MCTTLSKVWGSPCFQQIHNIVSIVTPTKKKTNEHYNILIKQTAELLKQSVISILFTDKLSLPSYLGHFISSMEKC